MAKLDKTETRKDVIQAAVESGATHAGQIMGILAGTVRDVAREVGDFATDLFEMREAAQAAAEDAAADMPEEAPAAGVPASPAEPAADAAPASPADPAGGDPGAPGTASPASDL